MQWLDTPPVTSFYVTRETKTELRLDGPTATARAGSGIVAGIGVAVAAFSVRMIRQAPPGFLKVIPLAMGAVGAGMAATGGATAAMRTSLEVGKDTLTFAWGLGPVFDRKLEVKRDDVEALEVTTHVHTDRNGLSTSTYSLVLIKKDGVAIPFETFMTQAQANLRKKSIEAVTRE